MNCLQLLIAISNSPSTSSEPDSNHSSKMSYFNTTATKFLQFLIVLVWYTCFVNGHKFDLSKLVSPRVFTVKARCNGCPIPGNNIRNYTRATRTLIKEDDPCKNCRQFETISASRGQVDEQLALETCARCGLRQIKHTPGSMKRVPTSTKSVNAFMVIVLAASTNRILSPTFSYEGSVGGDGCTFLEILFGTFGCEVSQISGVATLVPVATSSGPFANFKAYQIPCGSKKLTMHIPRDGDCGRREGSNRCKYKSRTFVLSRSIEGPTSTGCNHLRYERKSGFIFCRWRSCASSQFGIRVYSNLTSFIRVQMSGSGTSTCSAITGNTFFTI